MSCGTGKGTVRRRVCILTSVHDLFDQRVFYKEAVSLAAAGYEVILVGPGPAALAGEHHGVRIETLPSPRSRRHRFAGQARLLRAARRIDADVYHLHDPELLPLGCLLRLLGRRVIYDVHENFPAVALSRGWIPRPLRQPLSLAVDLTERVLACWLDGVVGVVDEQRSRFSSCLFTTVRNYPRLEWFAAPAAAVPMTESGGADAGAELVHVGSLSRERGAHFLRELRRSHPHVRLDALGPFHTRADEVAFHATVREYGLQGGVCCHTERLPYDELAAFIGQHRVGLIPGQVSVKNLTPFLPTKLFEYLACGIPVVASALPSIERLQELGAWGILADPADPGAHARAIGQLLDDPQQATQLGARGRQVVESVCNWEVESRKLLSLYEELFTRATQEEAMP